MKKILVILPIASTLFLIPFQVSAATTYATWNPSDKSANITLSNGNLTAANTGTNTWVGVRSDQGKTSGKWYWEATVNSNNTAGGVSIGVANSSYNFNGDASTGNTSFYLGGQGGYFECTVTETSGYGNMAVNDVIGVALDVDGGTVDVYKNNSLVKHCTALPSGIQYAVFDGYGNGDQVTMNFGATSLSYTPPSGYNSGLYTSTVTTNRLAKFAGPTTFDDSLFSDDGSNVTLTAGNLFMQVGALIDTITGGALNFGTTNATAITVGKAGITTTFPGAITANGLATFGDNIKVPAAFGLDTSGAGVLNIGTTTATAITIGRIGVIATVPGTIAWGKASTTANCISSASPASCGSASAGSVAMATGGSTLVVNTTAITANSQILVTEDSSLGTRLGITCNTTTGRVYSINARTAGTSFTIKSSANPTTNKACLSYWIIN